MADTSQRVLSRAEIADAIRLLTPAQWARLKVIAGAYSYVGSLMDADDLLQEAFRRALDGDRKCPEDVDILRFLKEVMRSITHTDYRATKRRPRHVPVAHPGAPVPQAQDPEDPGPNAEERLAADEYPHDDQKQRIIDLFTDDIEAQIIAEGMLEGARGEDLRALTDLDDTRYQSKRRLIRRRIEKLIKEQKP